MTVEKQMMTSTEMVPLATIRSPIGKQISKGNVKHKALTLLIYAIQSLQNEQELFVGKIRIKDFIENANYKIDKWDNAKRDKSENGYQREPSDRKAQTF